MRSKNGSLPCTGSIIMSILQFNRTLFALCFEKTSAKSQYFSKIEDFLEVSRIKPKTPRYKIF